MESISRYFQHQTRTSRRHNFQLIPRKPKDGVRGVQTNLFCLRTIKLWNDLPAKVVNSPRNVHLLKKNLDEAWIDYPVKSSL